MNFSPFSLPAPAKVNLFLHLIGKRPDHYHELQSALQFLDLGDELHFSPAPNAETKLDAPAICGLPQQNLVWRALERLRPFARSPYPVAIALEKHTPIGGGLGGGSSDAATTLIALNHLWECKLNNLQLQELALGLGTDVPFFVAGHAAFMEGIGERLSPAQFPENPILLVMPACRTDTAAMYQHPQLTRDTPASTIRTQALEQTHNDFEAVARSSYPAIDKAFHWLSQFGRPIMSGSGSCVFVDFATMTEATKAQAQLPKGLKGRVVYKQNRSPLIAAAAKVGVLFPDWGVAKW